MHEQEFKTPVHALMVNTIPLQEHHNEKSNYHSSLTVYCCCSRTALLFYLREKSQRPDSHSVYRAPEAKN
jgi:hypothetical protein